MPWLFARSPRRSVFCGTIRQDASRRRRPRVSQRTPGRNRDRVTRHRALWCSDFPPPPRGGVAGAIPRPSQTAPKLPEESRTDKPAAAFFPQRGVPAHRPARRYQSSAEHSPSRLHLVPRQRVRPSRGARGLRQLSRAHRGRDAGASGWGHNFLGRPLGRQKSARCRGRALPPRLTAGRSRAPLGRAGPGAAWHRRQTGALHTLRAARGWPTQHRSDLAVVFLRETVELSGCGKDRVAEN